MTRPLLSSGRAAALALAALLLAGCVSSDLSKNTDLTAEVAVCLPDGTPAPSTVARAIWYPNSSGFGTTDASPLGHATGVLALAGNKLWFMAYNGEEKHFDMLHSIDFTRAKAIRVERRVTAAMLVIESGTMAFDSFELMNGGAFTSDPKATQELCDRLLELRAKSPAAEAWPPATEDPRLQRR